MGEGYLNKNGFVMLWEEHRNFGFDHMVFLVGEYVMLCECFILMSLKYPLKPVQSQKSDVCKKAGYYSFYISAEIMHLDTDKAFKSNQKLLVLSAELVRHSTGYNSWSCLLDSLKKIMKIQ